jgi:NTP pyrophosphatase (non-canonical NTP hydrolase)
MNNLITPQQKTFSCLRKRAKEVVDNLRWARYHTPDNLSLFLIGEVAEFGEHCQWASFEQMQEKDMFSFVCEEMADIVKCVIYLTNALELEVAIEKLLINKIEVESQIYTLSKAKKISNYLTNNQYYNLNYYAEVFTKEQSTNIQLIDIQGMVWNFVSKQELEHIYNPTNLALAIAIKGGQIATCYQNRVVQAQNDRRQVFLALADILISVMLFSEYLAIKDLDMIIWNKFNKDEDRYWDKASMEM